MAERQIFPDYGPYVVVRYPTYYVVQDNSMPPGNGGHLGAIVYETRKQHVAHKKARQFARELRKREAIIEEDKKRKSLGFNI